MKAKIPKGKRGKSDVTADTPVKSKDLSPALSVVESTGICTGLKLPAFCEGLWRTKFLPTLFSRFAASANPWVVADGNTNLAVVIQEVMDRCFPGSTYRVSWNDVVCIKVLNF